MPFESVVAELKKWSREEVLHTSPPLYEEKLRGGTVTVNAELSHFGGTYRLQIRVVSDFPAKKVSRTVLVVYSTVADDDVETLVFALENLLAGKPLERDPRTWLGRVMDRMLGQSLVTAVDPLVPPIGIHSSAAWVYQRAEGLSVSLRTWKKQKIGRAYDSLEVPGAAVEALARWLRGIQAA